MTPPPLPHPLHPWWGLRGGKFFILITLDCWKRQTTSQTCWRNIIWADFFGHPYCPNSIKTRLGSPVTCSLFKMLLFSSSQRLASTMLYSFDTNPKKLPFLRDLAQERETFFLVQLWADLYLRSWIILNFEYRIRHNLNNYFVDINDSISFLSFCLSKLNILRVFNLSQ